jgi:L-threonylcarbamoyladenylate synthase
MFEKEIIDVLKSGGVGVIPTDTLYGIVASTSNPEAVERVYAIRNRDAGKACIILIADIPELEKFSIELSSKERDWLEAVWPGQVSIMLPCMNEQLQYLTRGTGHLVFRMPDDEVLRTLLRETGPLIAPSANLEGQAPAETIDEAKEYFGDSVDFYIDGGVLRGAPSTIVKLENDHVTMLRSGAAEIKEGSIL